MAIPIGDDNPVKDGQKSYVTLAIIILNVAVFILFQNGFFADISGGSVLGYGLVPSVYWGDKMLPEDYSTIGAEYTLYSYMFLHGGWMHLASNLLILWVFGDNIEQALGRVYYLIFYIVGGLAAGLLHAFILSGSDAPLIGASGAVSAVGAAYLLLYPRAHIWILVFWLIPLKIPAWVAISAWFAYQIYESIGGNDQAVAWWAHIGGFLFGLLVIIVFKRNSISPDITKLFAKK